MKLNTPLGCTRFMIPVLVFVAIGSRVAANDDLVSQTGRLRGEVKIEGGIVKVPPLKIQPERKLVIPRNQEDRERNEREIADSPVVEIPDESLVVGEAGGVANVVVYLQQAPIDWRPNSPPAWPVILEGLGQRFTPHLSLIRVGQPLTLKASGNLGESFVFTPQRSPAVNRLINAGSEATLEKPFEKGERIPVSVNHSIQGWKRAFILPLDHPFAAISDQEGKFAISGLPPGEHFFHVWHERRGWLEKKLSVKIQAGRVAELILKYPVERFDYRSNPFQIR